MGIWSLDGVCGRPACGGLLADYQCIESILQTCTEGRNGWVDLQDCGAAELCYYDEASDTGVCRVCPAPGEVQCFESDAGPARHTCAPDGQSWTDQANCPFGCVDSGEADYCAVCTTDELRCAVTDDDHILQRCTTNRLDFVEEEDCLFTCVDAGTADLCAACAEGELRCNNDTTEIERCNEDLLALTPETACPRSCIDNGLSDFCGECTTGQLQCAADLSTVQTCIDGLWGAEAVGIVGGEPKCCKSFLALDMAVAVASATPCLRRFPVARPGRVLLFAAEDALTTVRLRLEGICAAAELRLADLDLQVITAPTLRLDLELDRERLDDTVRALRPALLVLDPFVRLHRIDENVSADVAPLLAYLRGLQRHYQTAVVLVHHSRKGAAHLRAGQALRGSSELHAWGFVELHKTPVLLSGPLC